MNAAEYINGLAAGIKAAAVLKAEAIAKNDAQAIAQASRSEAALIAAFNAATN